MSNTPAPPSSPVKLGIPKGRMANGISELMKEAGLTLKGGDRGYRPTMSGLAGFDVKLLKPQNVVGMVNDGLRDVGFCGLDWVVNLGAENMVEVMDTGMDCVRIVVATPNPERIKEMLEKGEEVRVASEYEAITKKWIADRGYNARFVRAFGATESFPPEDADVILDNTSTGATLKANGLHIIDDVMTSSTRLYCNKAAYANPEKKALVDELALLLRATLSGRQHRMVEFNVNNDELEKVLVGLPAMRSPTVAELYGKQGYAVKICVLQKRVAWLLPKLKALGAKDIVVTPTLMIVE